ncbi:hypothetical protein TRFO_16077 [Tritrichomonas foetus]|uniref:UmuC domain-containing protein n=1 Tax=Tritrichomonas foetus TaxID=1144522 RepID=A0A1J4KRN2_9EUKA|nr:hypothetical protein TRFO_16077 [Tritrichomonas foetus]|eukprot:OHT13746.1 hypothetical protein TRFO_16077 [Tritrichomonas foetus]
MELSKEEQQFGELKTDSIICSLIESRILEHIYICINFEYLPIYVEILENPDLKDKNFIISDNTINSIIFSSSPGLNDFRIIDGMKLTSDITNKSDILIIPPRIEQYQFFSLKILEILSEYDVNFITNGLKFAIIDITKYYNRTKRDPSQIAKDIQLKLKSIIEMPFSFVISSSKSVSSAYASSNKGEYIVESPDQYTEIASFVQNVKINDILGFSRKKKQKMNENGIFTLGEILEKRGLFSLLFSQNFSRYALSLIIGTDFINWNKFKKSKISKKIVFEPTNNLEKLQNFVEILSDKVSSNLHRYFFCIKYIKLKLIIGKKVISKELTLPYFSMEFRDIFYFSNLVPIDEMKSNEIKVNEIQLHVSNKQMKTVIQQKSLQNWLVQGNFGESCSQIISSSKNKTNSILTINSFFSLVSSTQPVKDNSSNKPSLKSTKPHAPKRKSQKNKSTKNSKNVFNQTDNLRQKTLI